MDTNLNNFSEENKSHIQFKTDTKGDDTREETKDNKIRIIYFQIKALNGHEENLKQKLNYTLNEANDAKTGVKICCVMRGCAVQLLD